MTRHDKLVNVIYKELWKKLKFDHIIIWYMYKPEFASRERILGFLDKTDP